jgi:hypothetical protein
MNVSALYFTETEASFQASVVRYAELMGWRCFHVYDSRRSRAGFPDLVMVRRPRVIFAELKSERGKLARDQFDWLRALDQCGQEVYVWKPSQWQILEKILAR